MKEYFNRTKIVATIGPASNTASKMKALIKSGANVFRLNFSHGSHEEHLKRVELIRELNKNLSVPVAILMDLQGPKIRIGDVENGAISLKLGQKFIITSNPMLGTCEKVSTTYQMLPQDVNKGDIILIDDGNLELRVIDMKDNDVCCQVLHGGTLKSRKGINLPDTRVSIPSLTEKDLEDLDFCLNLNVDWVALSFVRNVNDILELREIINKTEKLTKIVAKIEKPEAVDCIDAIIEASDALMVARGDLGVEIPMEKVPLLQKAIVKKCNEAGKPVIVATQMLESMVQNPRPTRAEASDVANAIIDGADAIMLSAETAAGAYPPLAVRSMARIIRTVEKETPWIFNKHHDIIDSTETFLSDRVLATACMLSDETNAKVITGMTLTGFTAFGISKHRPAASIYIFTGNRQLLTQLALVWGVRTIYYEKFESTDDSINDIQNILVNSGILNKNDVYVTTGTIPVSSRKRTNAIRINVVD